MPAVCRFRGASQMDPSNWGPWPRPYLWVSHELDVVELGFHVSWLGGVLLRTLITISLSLGPARPRNSR